VPTQVTSEIIKTDQSTFLERRHSVSNFNKTAFLEDAKRVHLKVGDSLSDVSVRGQLEDFIDYDKTLFSKALDDVCSNIVGNTMFGLLMVKKPPGLRLKIVNIGPKEAGKQLIDQKGSAYSHTTRTVNINPNVYDSSGMGISDRQYYCVDGSGSITLKLKSLSGSIFHEFTHCLHHMEDSVRYDRDRTIPYPEDELWTSIEECRTIGGYIPPGIYDPICDNCFDLYESVSKPALHPPAHPTIIKPVPCALSKKLPHRSLIPKKPLQPQPIISGVIPYRPRLGHIGYVRCGVEYSAAELVQFRTIFNFRLAWPDQYMIP
jgi:hypothetical protein